MSNNLNVHFNILTDKQQIQISFDPVRLEEMTPQELALILGNLAMVLQRLPEATLAELKDRLNNLDW